MDNMIGFKFLLQVGDVPYNYMKLFFFKFKQYKKCQHFSFSYFELKYDLLDLAFFTKQKFLYSNLRGYLMVVGVPRICKSFLKFAYVVMCVCMGKVYSLLVRGVSRSKTLIPLILSQSGLMLYYNNK